VEKTWVPGKTQTCHKSLTNFTWYNIKDCQWLVAHQWFSLDTSVSSTNKGFIKVQHTIQFSDWFPEDSESVAQVCWIASYSYFPIFHSILIQFLISSTASLYIIYIFLLLCQRCIIFIHQASTCQRPTFLKVWSRFCFQT
jgi:hypothetical protein